MTRWATVLLLTVGLALPAMAEPQVLIDTDFGTSDQPVSTVSASDDKQISGVLPQGWRDDSGWQKSIHVDYRVQDEAEKRFLRITLRKGGTLQLACGQPGCESEDSFFRLQFTARCADLAGASVGMRLIAAPYHTLWTGNPEMDGEWRTCKYEFSIPKQSQAYGLWFYLAEGSLDLAQVRLVRLSPADLIAEVKARYPEPDNRNLVRISRFPLGLQSGWSLDRDFSDGDDVQIAADRTVTGPSGAPALKIRSEKSMKLYTAPFAVPRALDPHTASLYLRGKATGNLTVVAEKRSLASQAFTLSGDTWQRIQVTFTPLPLSRVHGLRIEASGELWLDALQVENGSQPRAYASQMPFEVNLACPPSDAAAARVQFADEPATVAYAVIGTAPGARLNGRIVNLYGEEKALPPITLGDGFLNEGSFRYDLFPEHLLGTFRIEAWVEDGSGKPVSPRNELVVQRLRRPRYWGKDAPDSPFGVHTNSTTRHNLMAKAVGCNWVRLHDAGTEYIGWAFLEPEKGKWQFRDKEIFRYRRDHLSILGLVSTAPGWATNLGRPPRDYFERYLEPVRLEDWGAYVTTVTSRYQGVINAYEVWNEPWGTDFWSLRVDETKTGNGRLVRSETAVADYARLQKAACTAAKAVSPDITILGFNTMGGNSGTEWTAGVLKGNGLSSCDAISYHHYAGEFLGFPKDATAKVFEEAFRPIVQQCGNMPKPVWMSEGYPTGTASENGFHLYTVPGSEPTGARRAANRLARYLLSHRVCGDVRTFLYSMHCHGYFGGGSEWSALVTADGYLHPNAAAHSAFAWLVEDTHFVERRDLCPGVHAYLFNGPERAVAVLSRKPPCEPFPVPQRPSVAVTDLLGNPLPTGTRLTDELVYLTAPKLTEIQAALSGDRPRGPETNEPK